MSGSRNSPSKERSATNFRRIFRDVLAVVLEQSIAADELNISLDEIP